MAERVAEEEVERILHGGCDDGDGREGGEKGKEGRNAVLDSEVFKPKRR